MTNETRTRAVVQAEIERLQQELVAMPEREWHDGDHAYLRVTLLNVDNYPALPDVKTDSGYEFGLEGTKDLIPAADLIPRAEHEAEVNALSSLNRVRATSTPSNAADYLIREYALDGETRTRKYTRIYDGKAYVVTVEAEPAANTITTMTNITSDRFREICDELMDIDPKALADIFRKCDSEPVQATRPWPPWTQGPILVTAGHDHEGETCYWIENAEGDLLGLMYTEADARLFAALAKANQTVPASQPEGETK